MMKPEVQALMMGRVNCNEAMTNAAHEWRREYSEYIERFAKDGRGR
jgi:hypothetical protein